MHKMCSWCHTELPSASEQEEKPSAVLNVCENCLELFRINRSTLREFLNGLGPPVLAVDGNVCILTASDSLCSILGKECPSIEDKLGGTAFECVYARLPEGCGQTVHCKTCTIRNMVTDTFATGKSHRHVPAYADLATPTGPKPMRFLISTERMGGMVLLTVEEMSPAS